ncbi:hypothetical protein GYH30_006710 [Glycine max]|nr:hypothetical protein GYH30_006710 [Glycine max]
MANQCYLANVNRKAIAEKAIKKMGEAKAAKKVATIEEVIIESLKTSTREDELRNESDIEQVLDEVVLEVVKVVSEEELQKAELNARMHLALETGVEIFS